MVWWNYLQIIHLQIKYVYLFECVQANDYYRQIELFVLVRNTWNHLTVYKKWAQAYLKMLSPKCVYKRYI